MKNTLKGNIDSKLREILKATSLGNPVGMSPENLENYIVSQLKQLMNEVVKEVVGEKEDEESRIEGGLKFATHEVTREIRNQLRSEILKRWERMK